MKKVNIQRDLRSRQQIADRFDIPAETNSSYEPAIEPVEPVNEPEEQPVNEPDNAQSENLPQPASDESADTEAKPKKRGRKTAGNL